jgi:sugar O-acyltransferase (sialic acid O-acetyltransferase NeuD family)
LNKFIIIGTGRHAAEVFYLLHDIGITNTSVEFADDRLPENANFLGKKVWLIENLIEAFKNITEKPSVIVAIGSNKPNKRLTSLFHHHKFPFFSAIHPSIPLERQIRFGSGITIAQGTVLTCNISIDNYSIVNIGCTISHDCIIGENVNISPGCHLAGNVTIEDDVFLGTGVIIIPKITIGKGSIIAAGSCIIKDVAPYSMIAGVPGVFKKSVL